jgi:hypothetical protein
VNEQADKWMSSLERGMKIREEVFQSTAKALGGGGDTWNGDWDVYGEQGMWNVGKALEKLDFGDWNPDFDLDEAK